MLLQGHYQNAYVTRDIDRALADLRVLNELENVVQLDVPMELQTTHGNGIARLKLVLAWVGKLQYELIQPMSGLVDIFSDALPDTGSRFHHVAMQTLNWEDTLAQIDAHKLPIILKGEMNGVKFLYADARSQLGHYLEYVYMPPR